MDKGEMNASHPSLKLYHKLLPYHHYYLISGLVCLTEKLVISSSRLFMIRHKVEHIMNDILQYSSQPENLS